MWQPAVELSRAETVIAKRVGKGKNKFFVFLREIRHELFDAEFQRQLDVTAVERKSGKPRIEPAMLATAILLQAYCGASDAEAVEEAQFNARWRMVLGIIDESAEQPPFSQATLFEFRHRLIKHDLDKALLDRTVAFAEKTKTFGSRNLRLAFDSTPIIGAFLRDIGSTVRRRLA